MRCAFAARTARPVAAQIPPTRMRTSGDSGRNEGTNKFKRRTAAPAVTATPVISQSFLPMLAVCVSTLP